MLLSNRRHNREAHAHSVCSACLKGLQNLLKGVSLLVDATAIVTHGKGSRAILLPEADRDGTSQAFPISRCPNGIG